MQKYNTENFIGPIYDAKGNYYSGEWKNNKRHGFGIQAWKDKNLTYTGYWKCNRRWGHGELSHIDSRNHYIYSGLWKNDKRSGHGINYFEEGGRYEGEWHKGKRHGYGCMEYKDGSTYMGHWYHNIRSGHGHMKYADGSNYEGYWVNDMKSGTGTLTASNSDIYEGSWSCDMKHGEGKYYINGTGVELHGVWLNNIPRTSTLQVVNSKVAFPMEFDLPECTLKDPEQVIERARAYFLEKSQNEDNTLPCK